MGIESKVMVVDGNSWPSLDENSSDSIEEVYAKVAKKPKSDDVVDKIGLDDDGNMVEVTPKNVEVLKDDTINNNETLLVFEAHNISVHDYKSLAYGEYLNDAIVDFYFHYLFERVLSKDRKQHVYIFSSHFYASLSNSKNPNDLKDRKGLNGAELERLQKATRTAGHEQNGTWNIENNVDAIKYDDYYKIKKWTGKVDIFTKRMLLFPVCENNHWFVVVVCNLDCLKLQNPGLFTGANRVPFVMVFDSLLTNVRNKAVNKIRSYLQIEHLDRKGYYVSFESGRMKSKHPAVPQQYNTWDCGVYMLHYIELMFKKINYFFVLNNLPSYLSSWFPTYDVNCKRQVIANIIQQLAREAKALDWTEDGLRLDKVMKFPILEFEISEQNEDDTKNKVGKNKDTKNKEMKNKETKNKDTKSKDTKSKDTPNKVAKNKDTPNKVTKNKDTPNKGTKNTKNKNSKIKEIVVVDDDEEPNIHNVVLGSTTDRRFKNKTLDIYD